MKRLVHDHDDGELRVEEMPPPQVKPRGIVVRNHCSVVSPGTERQALEFARSSLIGKAKKRPDLVKKVWNKVRTDGILSAVDAARQRLGEWSSPGYCSAGIVDDVGEEVSTFQAGDRVACAGHGFASHGEIVWVPVNFAVPIPDVVSLDDASFTTLGAIALHGIHRANVGPGEKVAVIGLGVIGQLTARILEAYGNPVLGVDLRRDAVETALDHGIDAGAVVGEDDVLAQGDHFSEGSGVDAAIITASTSSNQPLEQAAGLARPRGNVCVVGQVGMEVDRRVFYDKELELTVAKSYGEGRDDPLYVDKGEDRPIDQSRWTVARNMREFLRLLSEKEVTVEDLVERRAQLNEAPEIYEEILDGSITGKTALIEYDSEEVAPQRTLSLSSRPRASRETIGVGLIGAGSFAQQTIVPALESLDARLEIVSSAGGMSATQTGQRFGFRQASTDPTAVFHTDDVDAVVVATRHNLHAQFAREALEAGKHVFVEKPLALTVEGLRGVVEAYERGASTLFVDFNRRFAPLVEEMRSHFANRSRPVQVDIRVNAEHLPGDHWLRDPEEGGGRIKGEVCHFVDLLHSLIDAPFRRIYASGGHPPEVPPDDHLSAIAEFSDGSRGTLRYTGHGPESLPKERVEIVGGEKAAVLENFKKLKMWEASETSTRRSLRQDKGHEQSLRAFLEEAKQEQRNTERFESFIQSSFATLLVEKSLRRGEAEPVDLSRLQS